MDRATILLIEEDVPARSVRQSTLADAGYEVALAETGCQAIRMICQQAPAAVVMRSSLPGVSGIRATEVLKEDPDFRDLPVLLVGPEEEEARALEAGCDAYLVASSRPALLVTEIQRLTGVVPHAPRGRAKHERSGPDDPQPLNG